MRLAIDRPDFSFLVFFVVVVVVAAGRQDSLLQ